MDNQFELAQYHVRNPDPDFGMCRNTGEEGTDGVVFPGIEPLEGAFCFVGRQSILEAIGALYGLTVNEAKARMELTHEMVESLIVEDPAKSKPRRKPDPNAPIR